MALITRKTSTGPNIQLSHFFKVLSGHLAPRMSVRGISTTPSSAGATAGSRVSPTASGFGQLPAKSSSIAGGSKVLPMPASSGAGAPKSKPIFTPALIRQVSLPPASPGYVPPASSGIGPSKSGASSSGSSALHGSWDQVGGAPPPPPLWVENGVIWSIPLNVVLGFTDYPSLTTFFQAATAITGVSAGSPNQYALGPFSASDMPFLSTAAAVLIWPSIAAMQFAPAFLSQNWLLSPPPASGTPVLQLGKAITAQNPSGTLQSVWVQYGLFAPWGVPLSATAPTVGENAVSYDLAAFGWQIN